MTLSKPRPWKLQRETDLDSERLDDRLDWSACILYSTTRQQMLVLFMSHSTSRVTILPTVWLRCQRSERVSC